MKTKHVYLLEIFLMLFLCLIAVECILYQQLQQEFIYVAFAVSIIGIIISTVKKPLDGFMPYYYIAAGVTFLEPAFWIVVNEGWDSLWGRIQAQMVPFAFPVSSYLITGVGIFFLVYAGKRVRLILQKQSETT